MCLGLGLGLDPRMYLVLDLRMFLGLDLGLDPGLLDAELPCLI
jgi:hypothetical protein